MKEINKRLSKCRGILFYPAEDDTPDICGFLFSDAREGVEIFKYILDKSIDEFIKPVFKYVGNNKIHVRIMDSNNNLIALGTDIYINDAAYKALKKAYKDVPENTVGVAVFISSNGLKIQPISSDKVVLTMKGYSVFEN